MRLISSLSAPPGSTLAVRAELPSAPATLTGHPLHLQGYGKLKLVERVVPLQAGRQLLVSVHNCSGERLELQPGTAIALAHRYCVYCVALYHIVIPSLQGE